MNVVIDLPDEKTSIRSDDIFSARDNRSMREIINADNPEPNIAGIDNMKDELDKIDNILATSKRINLKTSNHIPTTRVSDSNNTGRGTTTKRTARDYRPTTTTATREESTNPLFVRPSKENPPSTQLYEMNCMFKNLQMKYPTIITEIPMDNDPDQLWKKYIASAKMCISGSTSTTWIMYMTFGYMGLYGVFSYFGMKLPSNFVQIQISVMQKYKSILDDMGDPGGISIMSNWSPMSKLIFVIILQTLIFIVIYKMTGDSNSAFNTQCIVAGMPILGGSNGDNAVAEAAVAEDNAGNMMGALGGLLGGNGAGLLQGLMGMMGGNGATQSRLDQIDPNNLPEPSVDEDSVAENIFD